jgi:hypothetical protein
MKYIYYINNIKYETDYKNQIPFYKISSPDENTPAYEVLETGQKLWCEKDGIWHRLTGPAHIFPNGDKWFYLNGRHYGDDVTFWLKHHPNQTNAFQVEMLLKYT